MYSRLIGLCLMLIMSHLAFSFEAPERRKDQFGTDFAYYLYPIAGEIPGLGTAAGLGGSTMLLFGLM